MASNAPVVARSLLRSLLRKADHLPKERRDWLRADVLKGFRANQNIKDDVKISGLLAQTEQYLDILSLRAKALGMYRKLFRASKVRHQGSWLS